MTRIEDLPSGRSTSSHPIDMEFGPNGSLYVLYYGDGFFGKNLPGAELVRSTSSARRAIARPRVTWRPIPRRATRRR